MEASGNGGRMNMRYLGIVAAVAVCLALAGPATATIVSYTVAGWAQQYPGPVTPPAGSPWGPDGYPGDTVQLATYTGSLNLAQGTSVQKINTLLWKIDYTYGGTATQWDYPAHWTEPMLFNIAAPRTMTIEGACVRSLNQAGLLESWWNNDFLGFSPGSTTTFQVGSYRVDVTPLGLGRVGGSDFGGSNPWTQPPRNMEAQFVVTEVPIPEPVTMAGVMLGIGSVVTYVRKRRTA